MFEFDTDISTENENDMGKLKGADSCPRRPYARTIQTFSGMDKDTFNDTTGMSIMLSAQAELDQLIHGDCDDLE